MRTPLNAVKTVAVWAVATVAGIGVCWLGVRPVLDAAVPDRLVAFPASEPQAPAGPSATLAPSPSASASRSGSTRPSPSRSLSRSVSAGTATASAPTTVDGWTLFPDGQYTRSFQLVGGTATVRAARGVLELVSATPRPGFVMTIVPTADDRVVVNFTGGGLHISTLDASWLGAAPVATITELP